MLFDTLTCFDFAMLLFLPLPVLYWSFPLLSILTDDTLYTSCRSTLHQGLMSPSAVCAHLSTPTFVPLLPSTAYEALYLFCVDDCAAGLCDAMFGRTINDITKIKFFDNAKK